MSNILQRSRPSEDMANLESDSDLDLEVIEREDIMLVGPANHTMSLDVCVIVCVCVCVCVCVYGIHVMRFSRT